MSSLPHLATRSGETEAAIALEPEEGATSSVLVSVLLAGFAAGVAASELLVATLGASTGSALSSGIAGGPLLLAASLQVLRTGRVRSP